jgi:hypothetical protein
VPSTALLETLIITTESGPKRSTRVCQARTGEAEG